MFPLQTAREPSGTSRLLSIGELAERSGVATTALRYYDELGLVQPVARVSGRRRYAASAVTEVGVILFLREVGFSLGEIGSLVAGGERQSRQEIVDRKLVELAEQQHRIDVARAALEHARRCPAGDPMRCSRFWSIIEEQLRGLPLEESHARAHKVPSTRSPLRSPSDASTTGPTTSRSPRQRIFDYGVSHQSR